MARLHFDFSSRLPSSYAALLWDTFFIQRGRGVSLKAHFPWIEVPAEGLAFATLSDGDTVLAGLTIRPCPRNTAAVGLVCVHPTHRGQGLSQLLLTQALTRVDESGVAATTLWTSKHHVYKAQGFRTQDDSLICEVQELRSAGSTALGCRWPDAQEASVPRRGLPPYGLHGLRFANDHASLVALVDPRGLAVAEWQGRDDDVVALLGTVMPARWRLHALQGDSLPQALTKAGATVIATPQSLQMWRPHPGHALPDLPPLRLLDRI